MFDIEIHPIIIELDETERFDLIEFEKSVMQSSLAKQLSINIIVQDEDVRAKIIELHDKGINGFLILENQCKKRLLEQANNFYIVRQQGNQLI